ncbi:hypothetical protein FA95DRAFT_1558478 [Auriscalpium vulgare]|uniref:Uncharacterized protein n=1 Tax=Auriscalpium vulgare TaxID=40419 RepID=A0ACB8RVV7_9AGAM|nr:hypothetical protein FA95DRAFT_1558478 [Auriscalpium vulgare]
MTMNAEETWATFKLRRVSRPEDPALAEKMRAYPVLTTLPPAFKPSREQLEAQDAYLSQLYQDVPKAADARQYKLPPDIDRTNLYTGPALFYGISRMPDITGHYADSKPNITQYGAGVKVADEISLDSDIILSKGVHASLMAAWTPEPEAKNMVICFYSNCTRHYWSEEVLQAMDEQLNRVKEMMGGKGTIGWFLERQWVVVGEGEGESV